MELAELFAGQRQEARVVLGEHVGRDRGEAVLHRVAGLLEHRQFFGGVPPLGLERGRQTGLRLLRRGQGDAGRAQVPLQPRQGAPQLGGAALGGDRPRDRCRRCRSQQREQDESGVTCTKFRRKVPRPQEFLPRITRMMAAEYAEHAEKSDPRTPRIPRRL